MFIDEQPGMSVSLRKSAAVLT